MPGGMVSCNEATNSMVVTAGGSAFSIEGTQNWTWSFIQTQDWNFDATNGRVTFSSHIDFGAVGNNLTLFSSSYQLDFFQKSISADVRFWGNDDLSALQQFHTSINLSQLSFSMSFAVGRELELGPVRLGIVPNSAGILFNIQQKVIEFDADIGNIVTLEFVDVDGVGFEFAPVGISLGLKWDFNEQRITFIRDTEIEVELPIAFYQGIPDSTSQRLMKEGTIRLCETTGNRPKVLLSVGFVINEGSYLDFDEFVLSGTGSIEVGWHGIKVSVANLSLNLDYNGGYIYGAIQAPGITFAENLTQGGWFRNPGVNASFEFRWGNPFLGIYPEFAFEANFKSLIGVFNDLSARIESRFNNNPPKLIGTASACLGWANWNLFCTGPQQFTLSTSGLEVNGRLLFGGGRTIKQVTSALSESDSVYIVANPYANTVTGEVFDPVGILGTDIETNPNSRFAIVVNQTLDDHGDLHLHSIVDGVTLTWNYHNDGVNPITVDLAQFDGVSLAVASQADLKIQSSSNPNRYILVTASNGITISQFSDGFGYYSPDTTISSSAKWKIIQIAQQDPNETFLVSVTTSPLQDTLLYSIVQKNLSGNNSYERARAGTTRFVRYYDAQLAGSTEYTMILNPSSMNYTLVGGNESHDPISMYNVTTVPGPLTLSHIKDRWLEESFHITWKTSEPATSILRFGPSVNNAENVTLNNQLVTDHEIIVPSSSIQIGWVYQVSSVNTDSELAISEWRLVTTATINNAPSAPVLSSPTDGATDQPTTLALTWHPSQTATKYFIQVAGDSNFISDIVLDDSTTDTSKTLTGLLNDTPYYWRVNAKNNFGASPYSPKWSFTTIIAAPPSPLLAFPDDESVNQDTSLLLGWHITARASSYRVQVSTDSNFATGLVLDDSSLTDTTVQVNGLARDTVYYWHVNAKNIGGLSSYSTKRTFKTLPFLPSVPTLVFPLNGSANQTTTLTFRWNKCLNAESYSLHVSWLLSFDTLFVDTTTTDDSLRVAGLANSTIYFWRVCSRNSAGAETSATWTFFTSPERVQQTENMPDLYALYENFPNPFNPTTNIEFSLPDPSFVTLRVYNALGEEVAQLVNGNLQPGSYRTQWNASQADGAPASGFASGVYCYRLIAIPTDGGSPFIETRKMLLIR